MNQTSDILGAQSSTLKKSFQGERKTDPLDPKYILPGHKEQAQKEYYDKIKNNPNRKNSEYEINISKFYNTEMPLHPNNIPYG